MQLAIVLVPLVCGQQLVADFEPGANAAQLDLYNVVSNGSRAIYMDYPALGSTDGTAEGTGTLADYANARIVSAHGQFYLLGNVDEEEGLFVTDGFAPPRLLLRGETGKIAVIGGRIAIERGAELSVSGEDPASGEWTVWPILSPILELLGIFEDHGRIAALIDTPDGTSYVVQDDVAGGLVPKASIVRSHRDELTFVKAGDTIFLRFSDRLYRLRDEKFELLKEHLERPELAAVGDRALFLDRVRLYAATATAGIIDLAGITREDELLFGCGDRGFVVNRGRVVVSDGTIDGTHVRLLSGFTRAKAVHCADGRALMWMCTAEGGKLFDADTAELIASTDECTDDDGGAAAKVDRGLLFLLGGAWWLEGETELFRAGLGARSSSPTPLFNFGGYLYLSTGGSQLYRYDGANPPDRIGESTIVVRIGDDVVYNPAGLRFLKGAKPLDEEVRTYDSALSLGRGALLVEVEAGHRVFWCTDGQEVTKLGVSPGRIDQLFAISHTRALLRTEIDRRRRWFELDCARETIEEAIAPEAFDYARIRDRVFYFANAQLREWGVEAPIAQLSLTASTAPTFYARASDDLLVYRDGGFISRTDGTSAGTFPLFPDRYDPTMARAGDRFVFTGRAGLRFTRAALDEPPFDVELSPYIERELFGLADGRVVFAHRSPAGKEPWVSDGTPAGTQPLADVAPGFASSDPRRFAALGKKLIFAATRRDTGEELFEIELDAVIEQSAPEIPANPGDPAEVLPGLKDSGCDCTAANTPDASALALLLLLWYTTRRRGAASNPNLVLCARRRAHGPALPPGEGTPPR